jgi:23S rRNA pseudouridine1911/1915/1917 synthase
VDTRIELSANTSEHKKRLEDFLFDRFSGLSRMYLREIVRTERCEVNGRFENIGYKIRANDFVEIELDLSRETAMRPEEIPLEIVFEDGDLIVVNKSAGMLVHPTHRDKTGTLLNGLSFYLNKDRNGSGTIRPGLVHRLDKQTSGLMVVAKTVRAHRVLADHFKRKLVEKRYIALVEGSISADEGMIDTPIGRYADLKLWNVKDDGKHAQTRFWVRKRNLDSTLVELEPVTGRTNQLRIHCAFIGHPIIGDTPRGGRASERLCLHAYKLRFLHPMRKIQLEFSTDLPAEIRI